MRRSQLLVFTTCYNERENIGRLIDLIIQNLPHADILVVDDNSPDGTWEIIQEKMATCPQVVGVKRPRKLGIGSAHKYALFYAMREGYKTLITMDADLSHDPKYLPELLSAHGPGVFVTGSRYCPGGSCDYKGYRNVISRLGNFAARLALNIKVKELTTYYRVFDVDSLRSLPLHRVHAAGYSYGVQLMYYLRHAGVEIREVPIHFTDRTRGASKIPRAQIVLSAVDLLNLAAKRLLIFRDLEPDTFVHDACSNCGDRVLAMKHRGSRDPKNITRTTEDSRAYQCTSVGNRSYPPVYTCLACGLEQVPESLMPERLELFYKDVVDDTYLLNIDARTHTFQRVFDRIEPYLPRKQHPRMLEVGAYCGLFLKEAERRGWSAHGVEPSTWAARYAREVSGVCVHEGPLSENLAKLDRKYDAVVSWDVLEHVRDPLGFLRECAGFLEEGGMFCFSTLDIDTWPPRLLGRRWPWLIDMHMYYFDRHVMKDMLARAGLELLRTESYTHYARLSYLITGAMRVLPQAIGRLLRPLTRLVPSGVLVPVALGDVKLYIARKTAN
jgi:dolichol-phosphate mannosyltransferase